MEAVTLETARRWCSEYEATLRGSFGRDRELPAEWERALEEKPADDVVGAIGRLCLLKHYYLVRQEQMAAPVSEDAEHAARQLLRREPVRVELARRTVHVTGRSYAAMYEIATHALRIRTLEADLGEVAGRYDGTRRSLRAAAWRDRTGRRRLRRTLRRLGDLHRRIYAELYRHRRALYAHALTPTGAPAQGPHEAPRWWTEIDAAGDALLLAALFEAGPGRFARLGPQAERRGKGGKDRAEDFGWASLLASIERQQHAEPAAYYDRDLFQLLAWARAGAPPVPEELGG